MAGNYKHLDMSSDTLDSVVGVSDMCLLEPVTEDNFIENLKMRFGQGQIYTYIGSVVVSVNPYCSLPLYSSDVIFTYRSRNMYELPPHIYAIADDAYRSMRDRNQDQCVIISGESGSGKTEASKVIMQFVAEVSGKGEEIDRVKEQLLQSNPVLEAFGNAKTNRNDNSSRFGKYMDIEFDFKGDPVGGVITNYLLEKSRVVEQAAGERSFHIFYQLLAGADTSFLKSLRLQRNPDQYDLLQSQPSTCSADDKLTFDIVTKALEIIGFSSAEVLAMFQLVASVLKLGNVSFKHQTNMDGTDGCRLVNDNEMNEVCQLLQTVPEALTLALTTRTVHTLRDFVRSDLRSTDALYARDALCKAIYSRLFSWIVQRINDSIRVRNQIKKKALGVLDIYGFEIFEHNSFEQFIINYCNEKLQQLFIELTLKEEQEEYVREGIEWIHVEYFNNAVICDLIEKNNEGMLAMLDEECLRPGHVDDITFLNKLNDQCGSHEHFESRGCRKNLSDKTIPHDAFRLIHYAGMVTYHVQGFIDKNNDLLFKDLSRTMYLCKHPLLKILFPEGDPGKRLLKRPPTAGSQFKSSISELMKNLLSKCPNYIRCIKPNDFKTDNVFEEKLVRHQVRYLGLMENVRVKRAGYAYRQKYEQFLYRYKMLCPETWPIWPGDRAQDGVQVLMDSLNTSTEEYACGLTKIFIRNPSTLFRLEDLRRTKLHSLATLLQKIWRGWHQRMTFLAMRQSQIQIAAYYKMYKERRRYKQIQAATLTICSYFRGWQARQKCRRLKYERRCAWAVEVINKYYLGWKVRKQYGKKFKAVAGPKIVKFLFQCLKCRFLMNLAKRLPSASPTDHHWPTCSVLYEQTSHLLRELHHRNRCLVYRRKCDKETRRVMFEKVKASDLFKDKKQCYPQSVGHEFDGDYIQLRSNSKWKKNSTLSVDEKVVFADIISKINRKDGKCVPQVLVMSSTTLLILDQRTLTPKYRVSVNQIQGVSLSPYYDKLAVFHIKQQENGDQGSKKGDVFLSSDHIIEIVTKLVMLVENITKLIVPVNIGKQMVALFKGHNVELSFKHGASDIPPGSFRIIRKGARVEVLEP